MVGLVIPFFSTTFFILADTRRHVNLFRVGLVTCLLYMYMLDYFFRRIPCVSYFVCIPPCNGCFSL